MEFDNILPQERKWNLRRWNREFRHWRFEKGDVRIRFWINVLLRLSIRVSNWCLAQFGVTSKIHIPYCIQSRNMSKPNSWPVCNSSRMKREENQLNSNWQLTAGKKQIISSDGLNTYDRTIIKKKRLACSQTRNWQKTELTFHDGAVKNGALKLNG